MDTTSHNPTHALSGHNPTLFNVVLQYADMDMLRALVLASQSMYETLQHCQFTHLTMVVLEAPILKEQQRIMYNGADPVPVHTFEMPPNDETTALLVEKPPPQAPEPEPEAEPELPRITIDHVHSSDIIIPDYARNFMARAQSVELVVYRRRLGTRISTFFTANAHHLKYGRHTAANKCAPCVESENATTCYNLHLPNVSTSQTQHQHCTADYDDAHGGGHSHNYGCIFSTHPSHEYFEGDGEESRRLRFRMTPGLPSYPAENFPYDDLPSPQLKFAHHTTSNASSDIPDHTNGEQVQYLPTSPDKTRIYRPLLRNLPLEEQQSLTTSLKIHAVDCVSFSADDWRDAIPGCVVQPVQTWLIRDGANVRRPLPNVWYEHRDTDRNDHPDRDFDIARNFPHLTSLVLQFTRLDETNRCGIDDFNMPYRNRYTAALAHFFIDGYMRLPRLEHFGVIGTQLSHSEYTSGIFLNGSLNSLNIDVGPQTSGPSYMLGWITNLVDSLNRLEYQELFPSAYKDGSLQFAQSSTLTLRHAVTTPRKRRKYNFSFDFVSPRLTRPCPHEAPMSAQAQSDGTMTTSTDQGFSQFEQHKMICALIHAPLAKFYQDPRNEFGNDHPAPYEHASEPLPVKLVFTVPTDIGSRDVATIIAVTRLAQRDLKHLQLRCHCCSHANTKPLDIVDLPQAGIQFDRHADLCLRSLLRIPGHVELRL